MDKIFTSRYLFFLVFVMVFMPVVELSAQVEGCTDPNALNYNSAATWNDGSCIYEETFYTPLPYLDLPLSLEETSGLIYWSDGIWTINDSGGDAVIYKVDTSSGEVSQAITISNGNNVDWEEICQDEDHIYVGDFGNNSGSRKDLKIYKLDKINIPDTGNADITAEIIAFSYADQDDFTPHYNENEYDCEAMICIGGEIYLFTKNWISNTTRLYSLSATPGNYSIMPIDSLDVGGLVTGADYSCEHDQVVLIGYSYYTPFLYLLFDYHENELFSGNKRKIQMPQIFGAQTEGICFKEGHEGFISCENSLFDQQVFSFSTAEWTTMLNIGELTKRMKVNIYPNPYEDGDLIISIDHPVGDSYRVSIFDSCGKMVYHQVHNTTAGDSSHSLLIRIPGVSPGIYFIDIMSGEWFTRESLIVN